MRSMFCAVIVLVACGGDKTCEIENPGALPASGDYIDPYGIPLPRDCIEGGLHALPGRWFVANDSEQFSYFYPLFEDICDTSLQPGPSGIPFPDDDRYLVWTDGTRYFERFERRTPLPDGSTNGYVNAIVYCAMPDDKLAAASVFKYGDSDPRMTTYVGKRFGRMDSPAKGIELVGELGATPDGTPIQGLNLVIDGTHAYVAGITGLDVIDISDPAHPAHRSHYEGNYNDVKVVHANGKTYAIAASRVDETTHIVDVSDPAAPAVAASLPYSHSLFVQQRGAVTLLYLADYTGYIPRYDITDPLTPIRLGQAPVPGPEGAVHDLFVDGDRIYANNTVGGFVAFDVGASFSAPVMLGHTDAPYSHASWAGTVNGRAIILHGDEGMTKTRDGGAYLRILDGDVGSPTFMKDIGRYQTRPEVGIHNFEVHGNLAYIAYYQDGVRVVDLSDPTKPREVAHYNTWDPETAPGGAFDGALGIRLVDGLLYVADDVRGLLILRQTN